MRRLDGASAVAMVRTAGVDSTQFTLVQLAQLFGVANEVEE
jgi:hypothetical protein